MFIEINEIGRYNPDNKKNENGDWLYIDVIEGKILINTNEIRCVSINGFEWEDKKRCIVKEGSQRYIVYFDKDRYVQTDIESYNKIKNYLLQENDIKSF